jgi:tetratricopeptide (TPR) repeat protein
LRFFIGILTWSLACLSPVGASDPANSFSGFVTDAIVAQAETPPADATSAQQKEDLAAGDAVLALLRNHQLDQALSAAQSRTQLHPESSIAWHVLGIAFMTAKRPGDAIDALTKSTTLDPKLGQTWYALGNCLGGQGRYDESVEALSKAIDRMPNFEPAWLLIYHAYSLKHDPIGEEAKFKELAAAHPDSPYGWYILGEFQVAEGTPESALVSLQKAVALKSDYATALNSLGIVYASTRHLDQALDSFIRAVQARPGYAEGLNNLGFTYWQLGQPDKAIEAYRQALQSNPKHTRVLFNLTNAYAPQKQWGLAKTACNALAQVDPAEAAGLNQKYPDMAAATPVPLDLAPPTVSADLATTGRPDAAASSPSPGSSAAAMPLIETPTPATLPSFSLTPNSTPAAPFTPVSAPPPSIPLASAIPALDAAQPAGLAQVSVAPGVLAAPGTAPASAAPATAVQPGTPIQSTPSPATTTPASPAAPIVSTAAIPSPAPAPSASPSPAALAPDAAASPGYTVGPVGAWVKPLDPDAVPVPKPRKSKAAWIISSSIISSSWNR